MTLRELVEKCARKRWCWLMSELELEIKDMPEMESMLVTVLDVVKVVNDMVADNQAMVVILREAERETRGTVYCEYVVFFIGRVDARLLHGRELNSKWSAMQGLHKIRKIYETSLR